VIPWWQLEFAELLLERGKAGSITIHESIFASGLSRQTVQRYLKGFEQAGLVVRRLNSLSKGNIEKIAEAYRKFVDITGFCRIMGKKEVVDNDYNLNVTLYVMPVEEKKEIDIIKEYSDLNKLKEERQKVKKISKFTYLAY